MKYRKKKVEKGRYIYRDHEIIRDTKVTATYNGAWKCGLGKYGIDGHTLQEVVDKIDRKIDNNERVA